MATCMYICVVVSTNDDYLHVFPYSTQYDNLPPLVTDSSCSTKSIIKTTSNNNG